jgi:GT2 family glycosyltransferase
MAIVVPCAAGSPWLAPLLPHLEGAGAVIPVSEQDHPGGVVVPPGAGFAERANAGIRRAAEAGFERALLLNDDTRPEPGALERLARGDGIVGAVLLDWEGDRVQQAGIDVHRASGRIRARTRAPTGDERVDAVSGAAMALPVALWARLGGFDEGYRFYFEDVDLCLRSGGPALVAADARVRHRGGGTRSHRSPEAAFHLGRSHARFARRLGGGTAHTGARLGAVATLGTAWTLRSVGPRGLVPLWRGLWQGALAP